MLENFWYPILEAKQLRKKPQTLLRLNRSWTLWRDADNEPVAFPSFCPHRGGNLGQGRVCDGHLECPWHGFRFAADGTCIKTPCQGPDAKVPQTLHIHRQRFAAPTVSSGCGMGSGEQTTPTYLSSMTLPWRRVVRPKLLMCCLTTTHAWWKPIWTCTTPPLYTSGAFPVWVQSSGISMPASRGIAFTPGDNCVGRSKAKAWRFVPTPFYRTSG